MQILARWKVLMFRNFIIFKRELQHTLHKSFSLENVGPGIWSLKGIWENRGRISGVSSGRISGVRSSRISGVGGRISRVGRHMVSLTISISIVESLMLIGMAVYSIVPRFRVGLSISFTVGFSFTFHNMDSTNWVCIISAFEIRFSLRYMHMNLKIWKGMYIPVVIVWSHEMAIVWLLNELSIIEGHGVSSLIFVIERITWISLLESWGISIIPRFSIRLRISFSFTFEVSVWLNEMAIVGLNKTGSHSIVIGGWISRLMIVVRVTWISSIERGIVESIPRFRFRLGLRFRFTSHKGNKGKNDLWKKRIQNLFKINYLQNLALCR